MGRLQGLKKGKKRWDASEGCAKKEIGLQE
jgi:hypothetical protein